MFFSYLVALMVHANHFDSKGSIFYLVFFLTYFLGMEALQFYCDYKSRYSSDIYNLVDGIYLILLGAYIFTYFRTEDKEELIQFLYVVNLFSWLRGFSQLRCFELTRIFIYLTLMVIHVLGAFTIVTVFGILTLSSTYTIMNMDKSLVGSFFSEMLNWTLKSFLLTLGDFNTDFNGKLDTALFIFGSVFLTLIMLNLVIALMSDAYEEVMTSIVEQDAFDTNLMIIDVEQLFFWKRSSGKLSFFYFIDYASDRLKDWKS